MSDHKYNEIQTEVVINADDCENVRKYCQNFQIDIPAELEDALTAFENEKSFENQQNVKLELCKWMLTSTHETYQDEMWDTPKKSAEKILYNLQFDKDLNDTLKDTDNE